MNIGRRYVLLMANATRKIPHARRSELLDELTEWVESGCSAKDNEELFWALGAAMAIQMANYCEQVQAEIGGEILRKALNAK